jgi:hypothetical protein
VLKKVVKVAVILILAYLILGLVYYSSGVIYRLIIGKPEVFSPLVGLPLTLLGMPWMLYADFFHRATLGIKPPLIVTSILLVVMILGLIPFLFYRIFRKDPE